MFRFETRANQKIRNYFSMAKINEVLAKLILEKGGNKAEIARKLGDVTPQAIGKYANDRAIPVEFIKRWKAVYGEDLLALSETTGSQSRMNVPHQIKEGDYIGLHQLAWHEFQETLKHSRKMLNEVHKTNSELTRNVTRLVDMLAKPSGG